MRDFENNFTTSKLSSMTTTVLDATTTTKPTITRHQVEVVRASRIGPLATSTSPLLLHAQLLLPIRIAFVHQIPEQLV